MNTLSHKTAIVIGASKRDNMGQAVARRFVAEGARVVVSGRDAAELDRCAAQLGAAAIPCDITKKSDIEKLAAETRRQFGDIAVAVNCTGWAKAAAFCDVTEADLQRMLDIQFKGPFQFFQVMVASMNHGGSLIQISSAIASIMGYGYASYMGTKAGIDHVVRAVANEFGAKGIRANSISPGLTDTPMTHGAFEISDIVDTYTECYPLGRIGTSADIAAAAVWLASDECFMTGQNLQVNGGLTLRANPTPKLHKAAMARAGLGKGERS